MKPGRCVIAVYSPPTPSLAPGNRHSALFCVAKDGVDLLQRLKLLHRRLVAGVLVGVQLQCQAHVGLADICLRLFVVWREQCVVCEEGAWGELHAGVSAHADAATLCRPPTDRLQAPPRLVGPLPLTDNCHRPAQHLGGILGHAQGLVERLALQVDHSGALHCFRAGRSSRAVGGMPEN